MSASCQAAARARRKGWGDPRSLGRCALVVTVSMCAANQGKRPASPVQKPYVPVLIAGGGQRVTLRRAACYMRTSNFGASPITGGAKTSADVCRKWEISHWLLVAAFASGLRVVCNQTTRQGAGKWLVCQAA